MSFVKFLSESIARKVALRDEALERAESREDAGLMAADIDCARTAHNKARGLSRLDGETLSTAGYQAVAAVGNANIHKSRKTDNLSVSIATGRWQGAECAKLGPLIVNSAKGEGFISRTLLKRAENGGYKNNYKSFWKPLECQGAVRAEFQGRSIVGYTINTGNEIVQNLVRVFG